MAPTYIRVAPAELVFDVQGGRLDEIRMKIHNITPQRVGFKLFTDQNDLYVFQPKSGFVEKSSNTDVLVKLLRAPDQPAAVNHVTVVKARTARDDEVDREKEWHTATPADEAQFQVVPLKTRFTMGKNVDEDVLAALRRIEQKFDEGLNTLIRLARFTAFVVFLLVLSRFFDRSDTDQTQ